MFILSLDDDDLVLGESQILRVLAPGAAYTQTITRSVPNAIFGDFFIIVASDIHDEVYEHINEEDNARVSEVSHMQMLDSVYLVLIGIGLVICLPGGDL